MPWPSSSRFKSRPSKSPSSWNLIKFLASELYPLTSFWRVFCKGQDSVSGVSSWQMAHNFQFVAEGSFDVEGGHFRLTSLKFLDIIAVNALKALRLVYENVLETCTPTITISTSHLKTGKYKINATTTTIIAMTCRE